MKRIFLTAILIACFVAIAGIHGNAQTNAYAKVTVYTNTRQDVVGMLYLHELLPAQSFPWSMYFSIDASEGQTVDGGYMYQKWLLLTNFNFPYPVGTLYDMDETVYGQTVESRSSYAPSNWPVYLNNLPGIDFRSQGGE